MRKTIIKRGMAFILAATLALAPVSVKSETSQADSRTGTYTQNSQAGSEYNTDDSQNQGSGEKTDNTQDQNGQDDNQDQDSQGQDQDNQDQDSQGQDQDNQDQGSQGQDQDNQDQDSHEQDNNNQNPTQASTQASNTPAQQPPVKQTLRITLAGKNITFAQQVEAGSFLTGSVIPREVKLKAGKDRITLSWKKPSEINAIDGYILLRRSGSLGRFEQVGMVSKQATSFTDRKNLKKNKLYTYYMVSYKKNGTIWISQGMSDWVRGVLTGSKNVNVYTLKVKNSSDLKTMWTGDKSKILLTFPDKAADKTIRWSSSNKEVATVSGKGKVTAKAQGTVTIQAKAATGYTRKVTINVAKGGTAAGMLSIMKSWLRYSEKNRKHRKIIDIYNGYGKLPVGYKVGYGDAWCDTCVSAAAIMSGNVKTVGRECGVARHVKIFQKKKIWIENGKITPKPGYIIVYNWGKSRQPNNSGASHIGVVKSVKNGWITTIEGNYKDQVGTRKIRVGWGFIRGYAKPKYKK